MDAIVKWVLEKPQDAAAEFHRLSTQREQLRQALEEAASYDPAHYGDGVHSARKTLRGGL